MSRLMLFPSAVPNDPAIKEWMRSHSGPLGDIAQRWFDVMRNCGNDVRELLHDGHPTVCVNEAAFCYVNVFSAHVNIGFFLGATLPDPNQLLQGTGKFMRHVKIRPTEQTDHSALEQLITTAYRDMQDKVNQP